jgi:IclR family transcriptional regulator, acetate operon repressor
MEQPRPTLIGSIRRALRVLETVGAASRPLTAKAIARELDVGLATTYHVLRTLAHDGYVVHLEDGTWVLGEQAMQFGRPGGLRGALHRCRPVVEEAAHSMRTPVYLAAWADGEIEVVDVVEPPGTRRIELWVGMRDAVHATAVGKAVVGALPDDDRREFIEQHTIAALTRATLTDRRQWLAEPVGDASIDDEEYAPGVSCVAVATSLDGVAAAVGVVVPPAQLHAVTPATTATLRGYAARIALSTAS